jgi:hypothetical protein
VPTDLGPLQLLVTAGAAGAFYFVLKWLVDGKLHTHSEVEGLRADKVALLEVNKEQAAAMKHTNELLEAAITRREKVADEEAV